MYINFKVVILALLLSVVARGFSQSTVLLKSYLEGDYESILESEEVESDELIVYKASAYTHLGNYDEAQAEFSKVENKNTALYYNEKGFLYLKMFQLDQSKIYFEKAVLKSTESNNLEGLRLAKTNLALYHFAVGNYDLQLTNAAKSVELSTVLYGDSSLVTAGMFNNYALALSCVGKEMEALKFYQAALTAYEKRSEGFVKTLTCRVYVNIALLSLGNQEYLEAEKNALKALSFAENDSDNSIFVYTTLGAIYSDNDDLLKASEYLFRALKVNKKSHVKERVEIYNRIAEVMRLTKEFETADVYLDSAIAINVLNTQKELSIENKLSLEAALSSYHLKGELYYDWFYSRTLKVKHLKQAVASFEKCIEILDLERKIRVTQKDKIRIGEISKDIYDKLIKCTFDLSKYTFDKKMYESQVFLQIQQSKAAVLNESLNENKALNFSGVPAQVIQKERYLKSKIMFFEQALALDKEDQKASDSLTEFRSQYEHFSLSLEVEYPRYFSLKYQKNIKTVLDIQKELSENKVLCSYYLPSSAKSLYIACVTQKGLKVKEVYTGDDFIGKINAFRNHINFQVYNGFNEVSNELFEVLIPEPKMLEGKSVVFFPDGVLNSLPFEALSTFKSKKNTSWSEEPYLIKNTNVSYGISTSLYKPYEKKNLEVFSLFAPVTFEYDNDYSLPVLPFTKSEVESIDSVLVTGQVKVYLNERANKKQVLESHDVDVLHLATHGLIDQKNPELSKLCLFKSIEGDFLYNNEIYNMKVDYELVTISACETGLGKLSKGEGVIGLTRAWVYAGSKNLIVSYWPVNDFATSFLMTNFYSEVNKGSFSIALQQAKKVLISNKDSSAPYYWAGFVLIGE